MTEGTQEETMPQRQEGLEHVDKDNATENISNTAVSTTEEEIVKLAESNASPEEIEGAVSEMAKLCRENREYLIAAQNAIIKAQQRNLETFESKIEKDAATIQEMSTNGHVKEFKAKQEQLSQEADAVYARSLEAMGWTTKKPKAEATTDEIHAAIDEANMEAEQERQEAEMDAMGEKGAESSDTVKTDETPIISDTMAEAFKGEDEQSPYYDGGEQLLSQEQQADREVDDKSAGSAEEVVDKDNKAEDGSDRAELERAESEMNSAREKLSAVLGEKVRREKPLTKALKRMVNQGESAEEILNKERHPRVMDKISKTGADMYALKTALEDYINKHNAWRKEAGMEVVVNENAREDVPIESEADADAESPVIQELSHEENEIKQESAHEINQEGRYEEAPRGGVFGFGRRRPGRRISQEVVTGAMHHHMVRTPGGRKFHKAPGTLGEQDSVLDKQKKPETSAAEEAELKFSKEDFLALAKSLAVHFSRESEGRRRGGGSGMSPNELKSQSLVRMLEGADSLDQDTTLERIQDLVGGSNKREAVLNAIKIHNALLDERIMEAKKKQGGMFRDTNRWLQEERRLKHEKRKWEAILRKEL